MKKLCLILAFSALSTLGFSQFVGDTIIVYVDNRVEIKVAVPDYNDLKSSEKVASALKKFIGLLPEIANQLSPGADLVKFSVGSSLTVEPGDPKFIYLIKNGEMSNTGSRDYVIISGESFEIFITTSDLSKIPDFLLSKCLEKVINVLPRKSNVSKLLSYECLNENITELENKTISRLDYLEITTGAGAGLVRSTWVPDISFKIAVGFNRKGVTKYSPYISSNLLFDFDANLNVNLNTFLNLGYQWNLSEKTKKPDLLGVELGYLITREGNLFGENTFKLGFIWSPVKAISVSPHLYLTDNFDTVFPGVKINLGF